MEWMARDGEGRMCMYRRKTRGGWAEKTDRKIRNWNEGMRHRLSIAATPLNRKLSIVGPELLHCWLIHGSGTSYNLAGTDL
jgi:hypothetical protein